MEKKRILVLTDNMPWGHMAIAKALYTHFDSNSKNADIKVDYVELKSAYAPINNIYVWMYRYFPLSNRLPIKIAENDVVRKLLLEVLDDDVPRLRKIINKYQPDVVISTFFFNSHSLVKLREQDHQKFVIYTVVADPWTTNPLSFVPEAEVNLVYDEVGLKLAVKYGVNKANVLKTGWWVRPELYDPKYKVETNKAKSRRELGFTDGRPVVFVGGGSLGTNALLKFLPVLLLVKTKLGVIFNTGTDKLTFNTVEQYIKLFRRLRRDDVVQIRNLGWIENMAEVLSACDLVFGKAGPNFLFDVVATGKPLVAITHIGGQEDGNIDLIRRKKLGWIKEDGSQAAKFLLQYLKDPLKYKNMFNKTVAIEAEKNRDGLQKVWERVKEDLR